MTQIKKLYTFTLVLKNVDENTPNLEDSLYEAGCDDALINFRNGTVFLDFDRESFSLEEAVISTIKHVESSSIGARVAYVAPEDLVTEIEIAKRLNKKRQTISLWIQRQRRSSNPFPKPVMKLSDRSPLWKWKEITEWLFQNELILEKEIVINAEFLENINAALEERDSRIFATRLALVKKLGNLDKMHSSL